MLIDPIETFTLGKADLIKTARMMGWDVTMDHDLTGSSEHQRRKHVVAVSRHNSAAGLEISFLRMGEAKRALALFLAMRLMEGEGHEPTAPAGATEEEQPRETTMHITLTIRPES